MGNQSTVSFSLLYLSNSATVARRSVTTNMLVLFVYIRKLKIGQRVKNYCLPWKMKSIKLCQIYNSFNNI